MLLGRKRRTADGSVAEQTLNLYYASDVHGSEQCWRKFLGAGRFYGVQALIMGGDLTGKAIVPIIVEGESFRARFLGEDQGGSGADELGKLEGAIRYNGMYPWRASAEQVSAAESDPEVRHQLFERVMTEELRRWIDLADERMPQYGIEV